jgi:hypothetical protein
MGFDQPSGGELFNAAEHVGRLLLIERPGTIEEVNTVNGLAQAIRADITVIDAPGGPLVMRGALIFGRALVGTISRTGPGGLLGRLAQGQAKGNQNPPWILNEYSPADGELATRYVASRGGVGTPAPAVQQTLQQQTREAVRNVQQAMGGTVVPNSDPPF